MPATGLVWRNWHHTVSQPCQRFEVLRNPDETQSTIAGYNATTRAIQRLLLEADEQDITLRAAGAGWSFTPVASTDGIVLATQRLNYRFALAPHQLQQSYLPDRMPVFLQGGISIADINRYLAGRSQAVPTSGASNGQTIAGALSTGTHGAAIDVGALPEYIAAIHLATEPGGQTLWLERPGRPILTDETIQKFDARPIRDDDHFNAALVGLGCLGIVLGVVIEPVPLYYLHAWRQPVTLTEALWDAIERMDFTSGALQQQVHPDQPALAGRRPYHLELLVNVLDGDRTLLTVMYHEPTRPAGAKAHPAVGGAGKGDSALDVIGTLSSTTSSVAPLVGKLFTKVYAPYQNLAGTPAETFRDTSTRGRSASSAMGVPLTFARRGLTIAMEAIRRHQAPAFVAMRFVKATKATLGFTRHEKVTAVLEVDGAHSNSTSAAQREVWRKLVEEGIPHTFHWGKMHDLDAVAVRRCYTDARVDRWLQSRATLVPAEMRKVFRNAHFDHLGLSS